jgi:hypothetical protein
VLLDEFVEAIRAGRVDGPQNARRALHLQRVLAAVQRASRA